MHNPGFCEAPRSDGMYLFGKRSTGKSGLNEYTLVLPYCPLDRAMCDPDIITALKWGHKHAADYRVISMNTSENLFNLIIEVSARYKEIAPFMGLSEVLKWLPNK